MAAAPVKSQPLHNFSLPHLKWAHKNSPSSSSSRRRHSPDHHHHHTPKPSSTVPVEEDKPWNLRPRKEVIANKETLVVIDRHNNEKSSDGFVKSKSQRLRGLMGGELGYGGGVERKEKRKIWISLSKEEIEEDIYAMTGGKPARRPRKWPKNVQKQLDSLFPGLYLVGVTAETYRDHDAMKGN